MTTGRTFVVAAVGEWNKVKYEELGTQLPGRWFFASSPFELDQLLEKEELKPTFIFFLHWRWIVPERIFKPFDCVCFHMTDVPYGRGGSPLQNLIVRGHETTVLTALKMDGGLDAGPVYLKCPLSLEGTAENIYQRAASLGWKMIERIIVDDPLPVPQVGEPVEFCRRTPDQSELVGGMYPERIYDHIRMLDAPGYPKAFIETDDYRFEFSAAEFCDDSVKATCEILLKRKDP